MQPHREEREWRWQSVSTLGKAISVQPSAGEACRHAVSRERRWQSVSTLGKVTSVQPSADETRSHALSREKRRGCQSVST